MVCPKYFLIQLCCKITKKNGNGAEKQLINYRIRFFEHLKIVFLLRKLSVFLIRKSTLSVDS